MTESFNNLRADPNMSWFRNNLKNAKAVMILRQFRAGFIIGASGGSGVMVSHNARGKGVIRLFMAWVPAALASRSVPKGLRSLC